MPVSKPTVLLVDDEPAVLDNLAQLAVRAGFLVNMARSGPDAVHRSRECHVDAALIDLRLPGLGGIEVLQAVRKHSPECHVVMMTGYPTVDMAVRALKLGARDYLGKPLDFARVQRVLLDVKEDIEQRQRSGPERPISASEHFGMLGSGTAITSLLAAIRRLAPYVRTALITGETGTGKELVARALHLAGRRADRRFVPVNCSAVVESLFESELFGHARGAFTGASEAKPGLFEVADGGVLFLDEVGELPLGMQAKLLRVLELGEVQRVGALETRRVDAQVVAATNRDLRAEVAAGRFRSDLYYRLNLVELAVPPLHARREDIPELARAFLRECAARWSKSLTGLSAEAEALLSNRRWEGNVRELRNVVERACLMTDGPIVLAEDIQTELPVEREPAASPAARPDGAAVNAMPCQSEPEAEDLCLSAIARTHIVHVLERAKGNKRAAARMLGVSRRSLYRRLDRLGLQATINRRSGTDA